MNVQLDGWFRLHSSFLSSPANLAVTYLLAYRLHMLNKSVLWNKIKQRPSWYSRLLQYLRCAGADLQKKLPARPLKKLFPGFLLLLYFTTLWFWGFLSPFTFFYLPFFVCWKMKSWWAVGLSIEEVCCNDLYQDNLTHLCLSASPRSSVPSHTPVFPNI